MLISRNGLPKALQNQMKKTQSSLQKTIGKLSTGQRINSAADDAAGLAISQKLRAIQSGTIQAIKNVQDAHSLVQVADGAMQEMNDVVQRIRELTIQAMNGSYTELKSGANIGILTGTDTIIIQNEIDELKKNLNDIVKNTEFNGIKLLSNKTPGQYIYEDRTAEKTIQLSNTAQSNPVKNTVNLTASSSVAPVSVPFVLSKEKGWTSTSVTEKPVNITRSTVADIWPEFTEDGNTLLFTRNDKKYTMPADGSMNPVPYVSGSAKAIWQIEYDDTVYRLEGRGSTLYLEKANRTGVRNFQTVQNFDYTPSGGFSFAPKFGANGQTSFVYADSQGNLTKADFNAYWGTVGSSKNLISTTDVLDIELANNVLELSDSPNLYRMNQSDASFRVHKHNDNGPRELRYWDGTGEAPAGGYYTVTGNKVEFFDDAIIGNETDDDAQDYYTFSYVKDGSQNDLYTMDIPSGAQIYNMHGEEGPRSLDIRIDGAAVPKEQLLASRPSDVENTNGVYVDEAGKKLEFYGSLRPAYNQSVTVGYMPDHDTDTGVQTFNIESFIDTYNLADSDLTLNRSLRVSVGGREIAYDASKTDGFTYDRNSGKISIFGNSRSDLTGNPSITVKYVPDSSSTNQDVYGLSLGSNKPEDFNLGNAGSPNSIRVYKGSTEVPFSSENGYQYNASTNTIELHGTARPNVGDSYTVRMVLSTGDTVKNDDKLEVGLSYRPETYGIQIADIPSTFKLKVNGQEIQYDAGKTNGFFYNNTTNKIEIYGDARPDAGDLFSPDIEVSYVRESNAALVGNSSYDFELPAGTLSYGLQGGGGPAAIRVYHKGNEIPYDAQEGYTYDPSTRRLSLHGAYRPAGGDAAGDYTVYSITSADIEKSVPAGSFVYRVERNGQDVPQAASSAGNGYVYSGSNVQLVGNARPDVSQSLSQVSLNVSYFDSEEIDLDESASSDFFNSYCEHETGEGILGSEIDPERLTVKLDGTVLNADQFELSGNKIRLKQDTLTVGLGSHSLAVDYRARHAVGYEPNHFTFQVGANSGDSKTVHIASFDNLVRDTSIICVRNFEDAEKGLKVIDHALQFVLKELGSIGAAENSFDHIASNLSVMEQTTTEALSRIEDADMAKEAMQLAKLQILTDAQKAMASHVKQSQEQVLELLK